MNPANLAIMMATQLRNRGIPGQGMQPQQGMPPMPTQSAVPAAPAAPARGGKSRKMPPIGTVGRSM